MPARGGSHLICFLIHAKSIITALGTISRLQKSLSFDWSHFKFRLCNQKVCIMRVHNIQIEVVFCNGYKTNCDIIYNVI